MASSRQIEHLERKHQENPEGLTFAPLANAYRNSGQPERAIEILMQGLEHHPDHAPARIVLGRCHLDLGDDMAAETAFAQVFDLDRENVVALKALADITERNSRFEDAARWLDYLLDADRNNAEAREQLERVTAAQAVAEAAGGGGGEAPAEALGPEAAETPEGDETAGGPEATVEEVEPITLDAPWGGTELPAEETADEVVSTPEGGEPSIEPPPPRPWEPPPLAGEVVEGLSVSGIDGPGGPPEDVAPAEPVVEEDTAAQDLAATHETEDDISLTPSAHNEFQAPDGAEGLSLHARVENEFQVEQEDEAVELRGSEDNEFQQGSDAELLRPSTDDAWEQPITPKGEEGGAETSPERETAEPGSWSPPAPEEAAASVAPESGPDGTPEPLEEVFGTEPVEPAEPPFEESESLPGPWAPVEDVAETIRAEDDEPSLVASDDVSEDESVAQVEVTSVEAEDGIDVEPGSLVAGDMVEEAGLSEAQTPADGMEADRYPEFLGSDEDAAPPAAAEPPAAAPPEPEPAFVATETMAEVYLSQGHRGEALEVYRALLQSTPGDVRLSEKVSALETELEGGVVAGERDEPTPEAGDGSTVESGSSYAASATGGQTVKAMFRGMLAAKPAAPAPPEAMPATPPAAGNLAGTSPEVMGEPTRPAQDPLSLSAIFGEDASPVPPALGGGSAKAETDEGFSFDSFFGDEEGGSDSKRLSGSRPKGREDEEDLDRFQSWLQGLKG